MRAVAKERAEQSGADEGEVAGATRLTAEFAVFGPSDVAAVVVAAFDLPVAAGACQPLARGQSGGREGGNEQTQIAAGAAGFLFEGLAFDGDDGGGVREAELRGADGGQGQFPVLGPAVVAVVRAKRGGVFWTACAAWARTAGQLSLSWIRYSPPEETTVRAVW